MDNEQWDFWGSSSRLGWTTGTKERRQENNGSLSRGTPRLVAPSQIGILGEGGAEDIPRNHSHCEFQQVKLTLVYTEICADGHLHLSAVNPRTTLLIHSPFNHAALLPFWQLRRLQTHRSQLSHCYTELLLCFCSMLTDSTDGPVFSIQQLHCNRQLSTDQLNLI